MIDKSYQNVEGCKGRAIVMPTFPFSEAEIAEIRKMGITEKLLFAPNIYLLEFNDVKQKNNNNEQLFGFLSAFRNTLIKQDGDIIFEPDYVIRARRSIGKPREPWGLDQIHSGRVGRPNPQSEPVTVAVLDSGVSLTHPDLKDNFWELKQKTTGENFISVSARTRVQVCSPGTRGFNFFPRNNQDICNPGVKIGASDHGTRVSGVIAADGPATGVAKDALLLPIKILTDSGDGCLADAIAAWALIIDINNFYGDTRRMIRIVNNSYGFGSAGIQNAGIKILETVIQKTANAGLLLVVAAGDDAHDISRRETPFYPAGILSPNLISVAASNERDALVGNDGCSSGSNYSRFKTDFVQVSAPGLNISTTGISGASSIGCTSASAALVSGAAAVVQSRFPGLNSIQIKECLQNTAIRSGYLENVVKFGRIDLGNAISSGCKNPIGRFRADNFVGLMPR